jgi:uncharacterized protein
MEYAARATPYIDLQGFLQRVFAWMFAGLVATGVSALAIGSNQALLTEITSSPGVLIGLFVVEIAVVLVLTAAINRLSVPLAVTLFFVYAALNGVLFAFVFELYTRESIFTTFLITAAMFGAVAVWGYTTKRDLSRFGTVLFMALIGLILATVVNFFVGGSTLYWITTYAGVLIFCGLTAYDMQKLKVYAGAGGVGEQEEGRRAILGALALYLDFINLFLFLLRIFGRSR